MSAYAVMVQTDPDDMELTESVMKDINNQVAVEFISSIDELENTVAGRGEPTVILVNDSYSNSGYEQLNKIKLDARYNHIPVVVLGEIVSDDYIRKYYRAGANTYITKPSTIEETKRKISTFFQYWFDVADV